MLTHFLVGKNSTSKYLSVGRFAYKWKFLKKTKFEQNLCHVSLVVRPLKEIYLLVRFHGYIYKNHSRKLEQHTHCHSFFSPFSLLTHCLTMCVTYLRPWMMSPHCERGRKMRMHRPVNWNPQPPPPPHLPTPPQVWPGHSLFTQAKAGEFSVPPGQLNGKPLIFSTRWGIFYGWWRCWGPVT